MHCPSVEPRRSLYFDYQVHPAFTAAVGAAQAERHAVVIVGAGPIGLTTALDLARYGIPSVLLEAEQQVSEGSRAIVFTRRSLEILQQVGVAGRVTAAGLGWRFQRMDIEARKDSTNFDLDGVLSGPFVTIGWRF